MATDPSKFLPLPAHLTSEEFQYLDRKGLIEFVPFLNPAAMFDLAKREVGNGKDV